MIKRYFRNQNLFDLDYENKNTRSVLLLYNILTMLQNECDSSYFPFDDFKLNKWNIEHIASRKDSTSIPLANRREWLTDVKCYIDKEQEESVDLFKHIDNMYENETYTNDDRLGAIGDINYTIEKCGINDDVLISKNAADMGGSQVFLEINSKINIHNNFITCLNYFF